MKKFKSIRQVQEIVMPDVKKDLLSMDKMSFLKKHGVNKSVARMKSEEKDEQEYDYEGDMVKSDLRSIMANAQRIIDMVEDNDNLPEWCQSKVTIAEDYISTVANYMTAEMNEAVSPAQQAAIANSMKEKGYKSKVPKQPKGEYERKVDKYLKKKYAKEEVEQLKEGRPSQRHPLEGHEYHKKSDAELEYIAKDAHKAAEAMKSHNTTAENKYRDQANDSATVRYFRKKNGMPEWYKKKYGHVKEEVEQLDELSPETLQSYKDKAKDSAEAATAKGDSGKSLKRWTGHMKATGKQIEKTTANIRKALNREEVEQIDELDKTTLKSYSDKAKEQIGVLKKVSDTLKDKESKAPWERGIGVRTKGVTGAEKRMAKEDVEYIDEKNVPTSPEKWSKAKAQAKAKFDVYPSAYANGWAAKKYKEMGGGWKSVSEGYFSDKDIENQENARNPGMRSPRKPQTPPFEGPYKKKPSATPGKFGSGYSTAKHLAKTGMKKAMGEQKEIKLSKKAQIVKDAAKKNTDTFQAEPQLSKSVTKNM